MLLDIFFIKTIPKPISRLKRGPAIDPAIPISPYPAFAKAQFRLKSAAEFPKLNKVIPKKASGILKSNPRMLIMSIIIFAIAHIHKIETAKANILSRTIYLGSLLLYVKQINKMLKKN